jgi:cis-3-alkyl-4-acyloxetan-2-one decarboxylase
MSGALPELPAWLGRELPFAHAAIDTGGDAGGQRVHVMHAGAGLPVVMLHGNPTWGYLWRKVARALDGEPLRVVMPDLVGLGLSDKPRDAAWHTVENHAAAINAALDALAVDKCIFVGQDWGGPIGLYAMATRPRAVGLVLANTVIGPPSAAFRPKAFHRFARVPLVSDVAFRLGGFPQNSLWFAQGDRRSISGDVARAYRWPLRHIGDRVAPLALARMVPPSLSHPSVAPLRRCQEFVEQFAGPIALVWGTNDPILGRVVNFLERHLPRARVTRTPAGHFLQEEVPDAVAAAIRDVARAC